MQTDTTKNFYEANAAKYAEETLSLRLDNLWEAFSKRLWRGAHVLDVGCGAGRDLKELTQRGFSVIGLEYSFPLAELAHRFSGQKVLMGDMRTFEFQAEQFDAIWAVASLLHVLRDDVMFVLRKFYTSLRPAGILLTSMQKGYGVQTREDGRQFQLYQPEEWEGLLRAAGFTIEERQESAVNVTNGSRGVRTIVWFATVARKISVSNVIGSA